MKPVVTLMTSLARGLAVLAGVATFLVMLMIFADVVLRFFGSGVPGTLDIVTYYLMLIVAFVALAQVERDDGMVSVDALYEGMPIGAKRWIMVIACLTTAAVLRGIAYASWFEAVRQFSKGAYVMTLTYALPIWPAYFIVPVAFGLATAMSLVRAILATMGVRTDHGLLAQVGLRSILPQDKTKDLT